MPVSAEGRQEPKQTLQDMEVHDSWSRHYRTAENDSFYGLAFDFIAEAFGVPGSARVLDAGCGSGTKSIHLAQRGFKVSAMDFSAAICDSARAAVQKAGVADSVEFAQGDLTALDLLADGSQQRIVCWGVLMHIPAVEKAVAELARVLAPGGILVISEGNFRSLQARSFRVLKRLLGRERAEVIRTSAGLEFWEHTSTGRLMTRQADVPWLISEFQRHGLILDIRRAGQFSELYTVMPWRFLRRLIHGFNYAWFRLIRLGGPSFGNLLVLRRPT